MLHDSRVKIIHNGRMDSGEYVLYWMQAAQRTECNHALEFAKNEANQRNIPLVVYFGITDDYPDANQRHYRFMLEGMRETFKKLKQIGATPVCRIESPERGITKLAKKAALVVFDKGYTMVQRNWRFFAANIITRPVVEIESETIIPVETASNKEEYAAATLRPKINHLRSEHLKPLKQCLLQNTSPIDIDSVDVDNIEKLLMNLNLKRNISTVEKYHPGGLTNARKKLKNFIANKLDQFSEKRNDPSLNFTSGLSPYLHFGQIASLEIALNVLNSISPQAEAFLEELIVRRELAVNYVYYNNDYLHFDSLPEWAKKTLLEHDNDPREYIYSIEELEHAATHDKYWNAAQQEMLITGKMHGYMRMYWGKKILEWSPSAEEAFYRTLHLNNKYELDGRDPNAYAGVAWCFGKHDRPWTERSIFGKVRYMNANGLKRKFDIERYVQIIDELSQS
jgi:deoxyribodipyrimidine photo-lyase